MNLTAVDPTQPPPYPPPQPPRSSFSCDRHPDEQFSGFCRECLCERLTILDQSASGNNPSTSSRRPSTSSSAAAAAALRALFSKPPTSSATNSFHPPPKSSKPSSFFHELRRTKSFSSSALNFSAATFEPQRKSCDVRGRNTLWSLFSLENEINPKEIGDASVSRPVHESEEEEEEEPANNQDSIEHGINEGPVIEEITVLPVPQEVVNLEVLEDMVKPMKDHLNLDSQAKKPLKEIAGNFWSAASVFSKKWHKWRRKQKLKKQNNGRNSSKVEKCTSKQYRDTQSEIADYGFGRRSCDTDPRFSLDDPRYSFDEPRASWDGYLIGRSFHRMAPMVSLEENTPVMHIPRSDTQIPLEDPSATMNCINEDMTLPGGSAQTRDYYTDSSSRRRKSLDRSSSIRKTASFVAEVNEMKTMLPDSDYFHADSNSNSLRDDCSETFELAGFRDNACVIGNGETKNLKKSKRWAWNILGFIHRRGGGNKDEYVLPRNYSDKIGGSFGADKKSCSVETNGYPKKRRDDFVLERNRSARFSPSHDNGLLRFYLTPVIGSRRGMPGKYRPNGSHSIAARSILRLY